MKGRVGQLEAALGQLEAALRSEMTGDDMALESLEMGALQGTDTRVRGWN